jgi:hypothetical protein
MSRKERKERGSGENRDGRGECRKEIKGKGKEIEVMSRRK